MGVAKMSVLEDILEIMTFPWPELDEVANEDMKPETRRILEEMTCIPPIHELARFPKCRAHREEGIIRSANEQAPVATLLATNDLGVNNEGRTAASCIYSAVKYKRRLTESMKKTPTLR